MESHEIKKIILEDGDVLKEAVFHFVEKNNKVFSFPELNHHDLRSQLWAAFFLHLSNKKLKPIYIPCLSAVRILSRDKTQLDDLMCDKWINILLDHSALLISGDNLQQQNVVDFDVVVEALKCLCNLVFNSSVAQVMCCKNGALESIIKRLLTYRDHELPAEVKYFDMKLLFIITALCAEVRPKIREDLHGVTYLIETLDLILKESADDHENKTLSSNSEQNLTDTQVNLAVEILKVLFNLIVKSDFTGSVEEEDEVQYLRLIIILHDLLLIPIEHNNKRVELHNHIINLLTVLPLNCFKGLITKIQDEQEIDKDLEYEGNNMEAVHVLLTFLQERLDTNPNPKGQNELLLPILTVLLMCSTSSRTMRKYLRYQILPPLKDVHNRPEQGSTLRNHLCRMLTTPVTELRDIAAELVFVLCKENVGRMIKYTGYGNAAGLFANRGVMLGGRRDSENRYSSDSEDSDTEEYKEYKHGINQVTGCYEAPHANPLEGMSEERKEYEAVQLAHLIHNLTEKGVIQPCRIGEDGKPEPIEHVLQLQEELAKQNKRNNC